jgi:hypothetical protein
MREHPDPYFSTALDMARHGYSRSLNLPGCDPAAFRRLQPILTKGDLTAPDRFAAHASSLQFPIFYALR